MINIDSRSATPIYKQIVEKVKENILTGLLRPGDKLPSVREMSSRITANPNTVSRAYIELERQKVIETIRGKGTYVSLDYEPKMEEDKMNRLKKELKNIIIEAYYMGIGKKEIMEFMDDIYKTVDNQDSIINRDDKR
ncbi:MAG: GntR family transcriptional regulator [Clostridiaceae bacterium]